MLIGDFWKSPLTRLCVQMYYVVTRRNRDYLEKKFPDIFGPHIQVRGSSILSTENQIWAR